MNIRIEKGRAEKYPCELLLLFSFESPERLEGPIKSVDLEWKGFISAGIKQVAFPVKKFDGHSEAALTESFVTGFLLGVYQFNEFKTLERDKIKEIEVLILLGEKNEEVKWIGDGLKTGEIISEAVTMARDLVNGPSNQVTPTVLAEKAQQIAKNHSMEIQGLEG